MEDKAITITITLTSQENKHIAAALGTIGRVTGEKIMTLTLLRKFAEACLVAEGVSPEKREEILTEMPIPE